MLRRRITHDKNEKNKKLERGEGRRMLTKRRYFHTSLTSFFRLHDKDGRQLSQSTPRSSPHPDDVMRKHPQTLELCGLPVWTPHNLDDFRFTGSVPVIRDSVAFHQRGGNLNPAKPKARTADVVGSDVWCPQRVCRVE